MAESIELSGMHGDIEQFNTYSVCIEKCCWPWKKICLSKSISTEGRPIKGEKEAVTFHRVLKTLYIFKVNVV